MFISICSYWCNRCPTKVKDKGTQNGFIAHQYVAKITENLSSIVSCALHRIEVLEPMTVKSVVEELNKLNMRIKHFICFCLL